MQLKKSNDVLLAVFCGAFFLSSYLVANVPIGESVTWVSAFFIVALALPSYYYFIKWAGPKKGMLILILFAIFPVIIESIGISTGIPYGSFHYAETMGFKILGLVPWSVTFAFGPLLLGSMTVTTRLSQNASLAIPASAIVLVLVDLVLDPAAVVLNIWVWSQPGAYYGVPLVNFVGWFITGTVASIIFHLLTRANSDKMVQMPRTIASSLFIILSFWSGFSLWKGLFVPLLVGILLIGFLSWRLYYPQLTIRNRQKKN
ncbi:MAG: carotenoid biosynthesis protein [Candidatus Lokiarchaeota archaeon]|nr:carotenoid biosynthesis protein [Candidatus Lokiarchaeota archaeon]